MFRALILAFPAALLTACGGGSGNTPTPSAPTLTAQTINFGSAPTSLTVGGTATVSATASSGLAVTITSTTTSICTVSGTTVTGVSAGSCVLSGAQAGNASYSAAPSATQTFTVSKVSQTISFGTAPTITVGRTGIAAANATSGLAVGLTSQTGSICTVNGTTVTGVAAGTCTIAANQAGDATYAAATPVTQDIQIITAVAAASKATATAAGMGSVATDASGNPGFGTVMFMGDSGVIYVNLAGGTFSLVIKKSDFLAPAPITFNGTFQRSGNSFTSNTVTVAGSLASSLTGMSVSFSLDLNTMSALGSITWTDNSVSPSVTRSSQFAATGYVPTPTAGGALSAMTGTELSGLYNFAGHISDYARNLGNGLASGNPLNSRAVVGTVYANGTSVTVCREGLYNTNTSACTSGTTHLYTLAWDSPTQSVVLLRPGTQERAGTLHVQAGDLGPVLMIDLSENIYSGGTATGNATVGVIMARKAVAIASGDADGTWKDTKTGETAVVSGTSITLNPAPSGTNGTFSFLLNRAVLGGALGGGGGPGATPVSQPGIFSVIDPSSGFMAFQGMALSASMVGIVKGDGSFHAYIRQ